MNMNKVILNIFLYIFINIVYGIYVPDNQFREKNEFTSNIKRNNNNIVLVHHNYSKVFAHNNASSHFKVGTLTSPKVFPVYNSLANGQKPNSSTLNGNLVRSINKRKIEKLTQIEVYEKCPPGATGNYVYQKFCHQFLNCWKGHGQVQNCAPGTLFNPKTLSCDFPNKVECVTGPRQNTLQERSVKTFTPQVTCPPNFSGLIPNYTDCSKFINCNNGHSMQMDCAPGTLFNVEQNICDHPENTICFDGRTGNYRKGYDSTLPFEETQNKYYHTTYSKKHPNTQLGFEKFYNAHIPQTNPNQYKQSAYSIQPKCASNNCQEALPKFQQHVTPNYQRLCNINDFNCHKVNQNAPLLLPFANQPPVKCPDNYQGLYKHPTDCKKFLNCANGRTFIQDCAPGTLFNSNLGNCDFPSNVKCETSGYQQQVLSQEKTNCGQGNNNCGFVRPQTEREDSFHIQNPSNFNCNPTNRNCNNNYFEQGTNIEQSQTPSPLSPHNYYYQQNTVFGQNCNPSDSNCNHNIAQGIKTATRPPAGQHQQNIPLPIENCNYGYGNSNCNNNFNPNIVTEPIYRPPIPPNNQNCNSGNTNCMNQYVPDTKTAECSSGNGCNKIGGQFNHQVPPYEQQINSQSNHFKNFNTTGWPPKSTNYVSRIDLDPDYNTEFVDEEANLLVAENSHFNKRNYICGKDDFYCNSNNCIPKIAVCNGVKECMNGNDEKDCEKFLEKFSTYKNSRLAVNEKQRWNNVTFTTCALLCIESKKIQCKSFNYRKIDRTCFLTDTNIGLTGLLISYYPCDYYELKSASVVCDNKYLCPNRKCLKPNEICDGVDDCGDRSDEKDCSPDKFGYSVKLNGSEKSHEGRIEITVFGKTGYVCDDNFGVLDADVVCKELGFHLGAAEVKSNSYFAKDIIENNTFYIMDDLSCIGNESSLMNCDFSGWGIHDCQNGEIAGVVCKSLSAKCSTDQFKCDTVNECIPLQFLCDGLNDCSDDSDEGSQHCEAAIELRLVNGSNSNQGRVEIKYNGIWGTVCDDDFNEDAAKVVCRYLGYKGKATIKKDGYYGPGNGPIWLDQVYCFGNESKLENCEHWDFGVHNCDHDEDVGVICSNSSEDPVVPRIPKYTNVSPALEGFPPISCGFRKDNIFLEDDEIHFRVVQASLAKSGEYPWQAVLRIKGSSKPAHWCGAVVISSKWVLTAAHCVFGYAKGTYIVVAGDYNADENEGTEQEAYIEEVFPHEHFREVHKMNNDIALIKLKGKGFKLNQDVQAICLPESNTDYEKPLNCTISGFGSSKSGKNAYSHKLLAGWVPLQKTEVCKMPHVYGDLITNGMICAGFLDEGTDACDGDSGGPLACLDNGLFTLYGLTSWGQHCGYANKPGVYVKVGHYRKWIDDVIKKYS